MAFQALEEIRKLRRSYGLNQKELAEKSGVSQSLIAKIESGKVEPTYNKAKSIFEALEQLRKNDEVKAEQIMNTKVFFASTADELGKVIKIIKSKGISQLPVLCNKRVCGLLSEGDILNFVSKNPGKEAKVKEIMEEAPPIVSKTTGFQTLLELIKNHPVVLVAEKGDIKGIISKTDLLGKAGN